MPAGACSATWRATLRMLREGTTISAASASASAPAMSCTARSVGGSATPGRQSSFRCVRLTASTTPEFRPQSRVETPARASVAASAVPQDPAPITATRRYRRASKGGR